MPTFGDIGHWPIMRGALLAWPFTVAACAQGVGDDGSGDAADDGGGAFVDTAEESTGDGSPHAEGGAPADGGGTPGDADAGAAGVDSGAGVDAAHQPGIDAGADVAQPPGLDASSDAGLPDGGPCGCGVRSVCASGACTPARRVFVSDETYDGALGGHAGADATCQSLATGAGLGGTWMAWISDSTSSPSVRFTQSAAGYYLIDGTPVASGWAALTSSGPSHAIDVTETGASLASATSDASKTWTATLDDGAPGSASCGDFASHAATATGEVGHCTGAGTTNWTSAYATEACNVQNHIYCFEQ